MTEKIDIGGEVATALAVNQIKNTEGDRSEMLRNSPSEGVKDTVASVDVQTLDDLHAVADHLNSGILSEYGQVLDARPWPDENPPLVQVVIFPGQDCEETLCVIECQQDKEWLPAVIDTIVSSKLRIWSLTQAHKVITGERETAGVHE